MENKGSLPQRLLRFTRLAIDKVLPSQLRGQDLNPGENRLRASQIPTKYMNIPDAPPIHDDSTTE